MKIAIIGASMAGLACALECEKQGIIPDLFERYDMVGWAWPSANVLLEVFTNNFGKDIFEYLKKNYGLDLKPLGDLTNIILKSPNEKIKIQGKLGYVTLRGKNPNSLENQLLRSLQNTPIYFNRPADYKELSKKYDYVVVADGKDTVGKDLGVWEDLGYVNFMNAVLFGSFVPGTSTIYFNTDYSGTGYARITPIDSTKALVGLNVIGGQYSQFDLDRLFTKFIEMEGLTHMEMLFKIISPTFYVGRVSKFRVGNILLAGRAAGLTERLMGEGGVSALVSGAMAARAIIKGENFDSLMKPLKEHIENISSFRNILNRFTNQDFDRVVGLLGTPGIKQSIYKSGINFVDIAGIVLRKLSMS